MNEVIFFEINNRSPAEDFLFSLDEKTLSKCLKIINLLENYGLSIGMPYIKKITNEIFELRIRGRVEVRFLFSFKEKRFYILHGFKKKKSKILPKDIAIARNRLTLI